MPQPNPAPKAHFIAGLAGAVVLGAAMATLLNGGLSMFQPTASPEKLLDPWTNPRVTLNIPSSPEEMSEETLRQMAAQEAVLGPILRAQAEQETRERQAENPVNAQWKREVLAMCKETRATDSSIDTSLSCAQLADWTERSNAQMIAASTAGAGRDQARRLIQDWMSATDCLGYSLPGEEGINLSYTVPGHLEASEKVADMMGSAMLSSTDEQDCPTLADPVKASAAEQQEKMARAMNRAERWVRSQDPEVLSRSESWEQVLLTMGTEQGPGLFRDTDQAALLDALRVGLGYARQIDEAKAALRARGQGR